jgi:hypothetical protein
MAKQELPVYQLNRDDLLNRIIILYGETETGKSTILKDALKKLVGFIHHGFVVSPMDRANSGFKGLFPIGLIFYDVTEESMMEQWNRQQAMVLFWRKVNNIKILLQLTRLADKHAYKKIKANYDDMKKRLNKFKKANPEQDTEFKEMKMDYHELIMVMCKAIIINHYSELAETELTEDQANTLAYLTFNPRAVWIFDDCTDIFQSTLTKKTTFMVNLTTMARHNQATVFIGVHDDKCLAPESRKAAHISIFTTATAMQAYFTRPSNSFSKTDQRTILAAMEEIFIVKHQVATWVRKERRMYKFKAERHAEFRFCSKCIFEFLKDFEIKGNEMINNEVYDRLRIKPKIVKDKL